MVIEKNRWLKVILEENVKWHLRKKKKIPRKCMRQGEREFKIIILFDDYKFI